MKIISIANQKGGIGKTTITVNLGVALARLEKRVLLVDLDPQGSLTEYLTGSVPGEDDLTTYDVLVKERFVEPKQIGPTIWLLPTNIILADAEVDLPKKLNSQKKLDGMLGKYYHDYDYILIDTPPNLGNLTVNSLSASHLILMPVQVELMAYRVIKLLLETVSEVVDSKLNPDLKVWRMVATMYDKGQTHHKAVWEKLQTTFPEVIYEEPVKATTKYKNAVAERVDVAELDKDQGAYWDRMAATLVEETQPK